MGAALESTGKSCQDGKQFLTVEYTVGALN